MLAVLTVARLQLVASLADQGQFEKYLHFARRIVAGELPVERLADLSAGYLWMIAALLAAGITPLAIRALQVVAVSAAAALCGAAAGRSWGGAAALTAGLVVLGSRGALVNATEFEPETLILLLHAVAVWLLITRTGPGGRAAAGAVLGLAAVTRPTVLAPVAAIALWLGWQAWREGAVARTEDGDRRPPWLTPALFTIAVALPFGAVQLAYAAFPGNATPMNPGTVLYEGLNPAATGYSGEAPQIVKDIEFTLEEPDALHIAYRIVAARALAAGPCAGDTNRFWLDRARAFARFEPRAAARLLVAKLAFATASYEAWDLKSTAMRDLELASRWWVPFGFILAFAAMGAVLARPARAAIPVALLAAGPLLTMVAFYVTSRQRNAMIPPAAVLAAAGIRVLTERWRRGRRREAVMLALLALTVGGALSIEGPTQREDRWGWIVRAARDRALANAGAALTAGDAAAARRWQAEAAIRMAPIADAATARVVCNEVRRRLGTVTTAAERFDLALAARRCGDLDTAEGILHSLVETGYRPRRGVRVPSSVAYQLAGIAVDRGDHAAARDWLATALREAPGVAEVLALAIVTSRPDAPDSGRAQRELDALHDPFSARLALLEASAKNRDRAAAEQLATQLAAAIPEWTRPHDWLAGRIR